MLVKFQVKTCCGKPLKIVTLRIPKGEDPSNHEQRAIVKAGFKQHICQGCYDQAYHAREIN